jgi:hypothetical protein
LDVGSFSGRINRIAGAEGETFLPREFSLAKFTILAKVGSYSFLVCPLLDGLSPFLPNCGVTYD